MPAMTGNAKVLDALEEVLEQAQVEDRLGDGVLGAGFNLVVEAAQFVLNVGHAGVGGDADGEVGAGADGVGADVEAVIEPAHDVDETDGVDVKDSSRVRIVAQLGRIAGEAEDVVQADGRGAQQIRLDGENIAVAAGVMQDRLNAGVLLNLDAEALRAHAGRGARRVGHVDGVHAQRGQQARAFDFLGAVDALGRNDFHQGDEVALLDAAPRCASARAERRGRRFGGQRGAAPALRRRAPARRWRAWPSAWRECDWAWCRSSRRPSARRRRWPCGQSWPCIPASRDRCCGPRRRGACRHWAWRPGAAWWPCAWPQWR